MSDAVSPGSSDHGPASSDKLFHEMAAAVEQHNGPADGLLGLGTFVESRRISAISNISALSDRDHVPPQAASIVKLSASQSKLQPPGTPLLLDTLSLNAEPDVNPLRSIRRKEMRMRYEAKIRHGELKKIDEHNAVFRKEFTTMIHARPSDPAAVKKELAQTAHPPSYFVPSLVDLCSRAIAENFAQSPSFDGLPEDLVAMVIPNLSLDLPLQCVLSSIDDESFWKRYALHRYTAGELAMRPDEMSYKRRMVEKGIEEILERDRPTDPDLMWDLLVKQVGFSVTLASRLSMRQFRSHLDLRKLIMLCPNLRELSLSYGVRTEGMNFEMNMHGIRQTDCLYIADVLRNFPNLTVLRLPECMIDDLCVRGILSGMVKNTTLRVLELSHNRIGDNGVQALCTLLASNQSIVELSLANNMLGPISGQLLAQSLLRNRTLSYLDLRLNRLCDDGGRALGEGLLENTVLSTLLLSSNALGYETVSVLRAVMRSNRGSALSRLDIANNNIGLDGGSVVLDALRANSRIVQCDVRNTAFAPADMAAIEEIIRRRNSSIPSNVGFGSPYASSPNSRVGSPEQNLSRATSALSVRSTHSTHR